MIVVTVAALVDLAQRGEKDAHRSHPLIIGSILSVLITIEFRIDSASLRPTKTTTVS